MGSPGAEAYNRIGGGLSYADKEHGHVYESPKWYTTVVGPTMPTPEAWHRIVVTSYGAPNEFIEGTFEGRLKEVGGGYHDITNGHFRVKRTG